MKNYDDIISMDPPVSAKHKRMSVSDRAAQFAPFAALNGYSEAINETHRIVDKQIELDNSEKIVINNKLVYLNDFIDAKPLINVTYFKADKYKNGGTYIKKMIELKTIDFYHNVIKDIDNKLIPIEDIIEIDSDLFISMNE